MLAGVALNDKGAGVLFTVRLSVAELSQPPTLVKPVLVCEPAPLKVNPFQLKGNSLEQMVKLVFEVVGVHGATMFTV
jgi:hypothetical protein